VNNKITRQQLEMNPLINDLPWRKDVIASGLFSMIVVYSKQGK